MYSYYDLPTYLQSYTDFMLHKAMTTDKAVLDLRFDSYKTYIE